MTRKLYKKVDGEWRWFDLDEKPDETPFFIQGDTLDKPLKHPVTGKMYDSRSEYLKATKALGLEVVGDEKLSQRPRNLKENITDDKIIDAIQRAEAIQSDPFKRNQFKRMNEIRTEMAEKALYGQKR